MSAYAMTAGRFSRMLFKKKDENKMNDNRINDPKDQDNNDQDLSNRQTLLFARDLNQAYLDIKTAHQQLHESYIDTIKCLVLASEFKDSDTGSHLKRIGKYSVLIAEKLGLDKKAIENLRFAAPMHDIGKVGIPDRILTKKGKLTKSEFTVMKSHTLIGARILAGSNSDILQMAHNIAISHHEKWDGRGYPCGLKGNEIPLEGRIVAVCDFFDALTSKRPYRGAFPVETVIDMIKTERGSHFDPRIVDIFLGLVNEFKKQMRKNGQSEL
jgi:putative two-component system response regulator